MQVRCLLWDFGNTLCDELSLWRVSPEWMEVYRSFDDGLGAAWSLGDLDTSGFVDALAKRMPLTEVEILAHLKRTDLFEFFPFTYAFFPISAPEGKRTSSLKKKRSSCASGSG